MNELYVNIKNGTASCFIASFFFKEKSNRIRRIQSDFDPSVLWDKYDEFPWC